MDDFKAVFDIYETGEDADFRNELENVHKLFNVLINQFFKSHF